MSEQDGAPERGDAAELKLSGGRDGFPESLVAGMAVLPDFPTNEFRKAIHPFEEDTGVIWSRAELRAYPKTVSPRPRLGGEGRG
jgi:hypothetical protein